MMSFNGRLKIVFDKKLCAKINVEIIGFLYSFREIYQSYLFLSVVKIAAVKFIIFESINKNIKFIFENFCKKSFKFFISFS